MRYTVILRYIGTALLLCSLFEFVAAGIAAYHGADSSMLPLLMAGTLSFAIGIYPRIFVRPVKEMSRKESAFVVIGSWLATCIFGTFPYLFWGGMTPLDALFESVSGFTTTGASILNDIESLPRGLLFWRMTTSWIGGMGIIVFATILLPSVNRAGSSMSRAEGSALSEYVHEGGYRKSARPVLSIYIGLTLLCMLALKLSGMGWFDSLNHAMSTISTCGFSTRNASIAHYDSTLIYTVITVFMFTAGISFTHLWMAAMGKRGLLHSEVLRWYAVFATVATFICAVSLMGSGVGAGSALSQASFHVVSLLTTTGFAIADTNLWPPLCMSVLTVCSVVCACSGSTTGGLKMDRLMIASKSVRNFLRHDAQPNSVYAVHANGKAVTPTAVGEAMVFISLYVATLLLGFMLNTSFGMDSESAFSASVACLGNVGPGFGSVGSMDNYAHLPALAKVTAMSLMLMGRLEIIGVFRIFWFRR